MKSTEVIFSMLKEHGLNIVIEGEDTYNHDYDALELKADSMTIKYRKGKLTPKKKGHFVVMWKKDIQNKNMPFEDTDDIDGLMILVEEKEQFGFFLFPKYILIDNGILRSTKHPGKMGFRVYTPWDTSLNASATKTFKWQNPYFFPMDSMSIDTGRITQVIKTMKK